MKAILTEDFNYALDGRTVTAFKAGDEVEGDVAKSAAAQGKAKPVEKMAKAPASNKTDAPKSNKAKE
mgnify:CR=1 FL=1